MKMEAHKETLCDDRGRDSDDLSIGQEDQGLSANTSRREEVSKDSAQSQREHGCADASISDR